MSKYTKISFYFRTQEQYEAIMELVDSALRDLIMNHNMRRNLFSPEYITLRSPAYKMDTVKHRIPKRKPGKKKYIGTLGIDLKVYALLNIDVQHELFNVIGVEPVPAKSNKPKYREEDLTRESLTLKNPEHFKKLTSLMNKEYGHGNWHLRGARKILRKLREAEMIKTEKANGNLRLTRSVSRNMQEIVDNGLKVDVVVTGKVDNLKPLLFKLQLMT